MAFDPTFFFLGHQHSTVTTTTVLTSGTSIAGYSKEFVRDPNFILGWRAPAGTGSVYIGYDLGGTPGVREVVIGYDPRTGSLQDSVDLQYADDAAFTSPTTVGVPLSFHPYATWGIPIGIRRVTLGSTITKRYWRLLCTYADRYSSSIMPKITFFGLYGNNPVSDRFSYADFGYSQPIEPGELSTIYATAQDETLALVPVVNAYGGSRCEFEVSLRSTTVTVAQKIQRWAEKVTRRATYVEFDGIYPNFDDRGDSGGSTYYGTFARLIDDTLKFYRYHTGIYDITFKMRSEPWL